MIRRVPYAPASRLTSRAVAQSAWRETRLMTPPTPPRPKIMAFGPFRASTRSTLYRSRKYCVSSRTPSTKKSDVDELPRKIGVSRLPSPCAIPTPGTYRTRSAMPCIR